MSLSLIPVMGVDFFICPKSDYIHYNALGSYSQWWYRQIQTYALDAAYRHLVPNPGPKRRRTRWSRHTDNRPMVSHTTVLPDGQEITYEWKSIHGHEIRRYWGRDWSKMKLREEDTFRVGHAKGVKRRKGRIEDSFNRAEKTLEFRNNAKITTRWPQSNSAKRAAQVQDNRAARRQVREQIHKAGKLAPYVDKWDQICDWQDPRDTWSWS